MSKVFGKDSVSYDSAETDSAPSCAQVVGGLAITAMLVTSTVGIVALVKHNNTVQQHDRAIIVSAIQSDGFDRAIGMGKIAPTLSDDSSNTFIADIDHLYVGQDCDIPDVTAVFDPAGTNIDHYDTLVDIHRVRSGKNNYRSEGTKVSFGNAAEAHAIPQLGC